MSFRLKYHVVRVILVSNIMRNTEKQFEIGEMCAPFALRCLRLVSPATRRRVISRWDFASGRHICFWTQRLWRMWINRSENVIHWGFRGGSPQGTAPDSSIADALIQHDVWSGLSTNESVTFWMTIKGNTKGKGLFRISCKGCDRVHNTSFRFQLLY